MVHIPPDFLGPKDPNFNFRVINGRTITPGSPRDLIPGLAKEFERRLFETALGQSESKQWRWG
jgi:hypothetical protein